MPADCPKRLNWKWEELVLACDLLMQNNGGSVDHEDPRAIELSEVLRKMTLHPQQDRLPRFRNPNDVAQKTRNLVQHLPGYTGSRSSGSALDREVVERFLAEPEAMHELAQSIRAKVAVGEPLESRPTKQTVSLNVITRDAVLKAMEDYDALGQSEFLDIYGFHPARSYVLVHNGKRYDSKAIVGVAHGYLPGKEPLTASDFSGGEATVGRLLRRLGFTLQVGDDLTPARLEAILASLNVNRPNGIPALYQPITLLWAFSRARHGDPRIVSWARRNTSSRRFSTVMVAQERATESSTRSPRCTMSACGSSMPIQSRSPRRTAAQSRSAGSTPVSRTAGWSSLSTTSSASHPRH